MRFDRAYGHRHRLCCSQQILLNWPGTVQTCGVHRGIVASLFEIVNVASNVAPRSGDALAALQRRPDADRKKFLRTGQAPRTFTRPLQNEKSPSALK
jgi:hypothetical protein